jgi:hypothetical protein
LRVLLEVIDELLLLRVVVAVTSSDGMRVNVASMSSEALLVVVVVVVLATSPSLPIANTTGLLVGDALVAGAGVVDEEAVVVVVGIGVVVVAVVAGVVVVGAITGGGRAAGGRMAEQRVRISSSTINPHRPGAKILLQIVRSEERPMMAGYDTIRCDTMFIP